jgi:hypothetical protein
MAASKRSDFSLLLWRLTTPRMPAQCNERDIMAPQARCHGRTVSSRGLGEVTHDDELFNARGGRTVKR